jgi:cyclohexanecarboxylate-CoA ligase
VDLILDQVLAASTTEKGRDLVVAGTTRVDGATLERAVAGLAGGLQTAGVGSGDRVAWQRPNDATALALYRACWRLGAVAAPIHHHASPAEVELLVDRLAPAVPVIGDDREHPLLEDLWGPPVERGAVPVAPDDVAVVLWTSGSSGRPKGVPHTHAGLAGKAQVMAAVHGLTPDDAVLMPAPLAHVSGLLNGVLLPGVVPFPVVLMPRWDPDQALDLIEQEQVTFMLGPPTFFVSLMDTPSFDPDRVASLRLISCGGAGVTPAFAERAARTLGAVVKRTYGSTEAPTVTTSGPDDDDETRWATDGRPVGDVEIRIAGTGEIQLRGPEVLRGYLDPEDDREAFADGWFRTGDLGRVDDRGRLVVTGRLKDVIIRGGENIAASEVEDVLERHPAVAQAVVVAEPDDRLGERVAAFVVADLAAGAFDLERCRAWCAEQGLARFKTPERVEVLASLPLLAAGKPDRAALRRLL